MTAACFAGELQGLVIVHGCTPSVIYHNRVAFIYQWEVPGKLARYLILPGFDFFIIPGRVAQPIPPIRLH
jgi:hypothetical protein